MTEILRPFPGGKPKKSKNDFWFQIVLALILIGFVIYGVFWVREKQWEAHESDHRATCASRLSQIGKALIIYSNENGGQLPPDLAILTKDPLLAMEVFICPRTRGKPAIRTEDLQSCRTALLNPKHNSYIYCGETLSFENFKIDSEIVLAFERPSNHKVGLNVLFGDGHVEWESTSFENVQKMLKDADSGIRPVRLQLP